MKKIWLALAAVAAMIPLGVFSQEPAEPKQPDFGVIEVHTAEAIRRGNSVVVAGEGPRGASQEAEIAATAPPLDDSHMWFFTVFKQPNCAPCEQLLRDVKSSDYLRAFVEPAPGQTTAWAHFNVYDIKDETQKDRLKRYVIGGTPTVIIQPPRNGSWGPPSIVVCQFTGYDGDAKKLCENISNGVREYARKMAKQGYPRHNIGPASALTGLETPADPTVGGASQTAPFTPPNPFQPPQPQPSQFPNNINFPPQVQPQPAPAPTPAPAPSRPLLDWLLGGSMNLILLLLLAARLFEMYTKTTPSLTDDQLAAMIVNVLSTVSGGQTEIPKNRIKAAIAEAKAH